MQSCCEQYVPEPECLGICVGSCDLWNSPIMSRLIINFESVCKPYVYVAKYCCILIHGNKSSTLLTTSPISNPTEYSVIAVTCAICTKATFKTTEVTVRMSATTTGIQFGWLL